MNFPVSQMLQNTSKIQKHLKLVVQVMLLVEHLNRTLVKIGISPRCNFPRDLRL